MIHLAACFEEKKKKKIDEHAFAYQNPLQAQKQEDTALAWGSWELYRAREGLPKLPIGRNNVVENPGLAISGGDPEWEGLTI